MNTLLLHPTDTLFFRDGRPMGGSLSGHGAAWPLPSVLNAALHAALHRAALPEVHSHRPGRSSERSPEADRDRKFGSLLTAGPFPVNPAGQWFFPRPADAGEIDSTAVTHHPAAIPGANSLPAPLTHAIANTQPPTKDQPAPWWNTAAWQAYLAGSKKRVLRVLPPANPPPVPSAPLHAADSDFSDTEHSIGIGISPDTGTQNGDQLYSAHSLRLRPGWSLGALAEAMDKLNGESATKRDLIQNLFPNSGARTPVIVGGQQRLCTVECSRHTPLPLPVGPTISGIHVKWILLTPAIFPCIQPGTAKSGNTITAHPGGWLPNWIDPQTGAVLLKSGDTARREREGREAWRERVRREGRTIPAKLVAALTAKPLPITGYALPNAADPERSAGGAKCTHLAVPAGSVYYFEAEGKDDAEKQANALALAAALNWHGPDTSPTTLRNRRSTLMGEKGFGLGVCGSWQPLPSS